MRKIGVALCVLAFFAKNAFCDVLQDCRIYDAVLGIENYMKWLRLYDGAEYPEKIPVKEYALIGKKEAFAAYKSLAQAGDVQAMCAVAECYDYGVLDNADFIEAFSWWSKAAETGYAPALNALGTFYSPTSFQIANVIADENKAHDYFEKAAAAGYSKAFANLERYDEAVAEGFSDAYVFYASKILEKNPSDYEKAIQIFEKAADECSPDFARYAMYSLMEIFSSKENGFYDENKARLWAKRYSDANFEAIKAARAKNRELLPYLKKRADVGDVHSMYDLALLYGSNYFFAENPAYRALHIFYMRKAAEGGNRRAMIAIAEYYNNGNGVAQNKQKAAELFLSAMRYDDTISAQSLRSIFIESLPAPARAYVNFYAKQRGDWSYNRSYTASYEGISPEYAVSYFVSHANDDEDCKNAAAVCLQFGIGCEADEKKALELGYSPIPDEVESEEDFLKNRDEYLKNRREEEHRLLEAAESEQTGESLYALFDFYDGVYNTLDTDSRCFELLQLAAQKNNADAQYELAHYYQDGKSCASDPKTAFTYLQLSAEQGNVLAQSDLAECYFQGFGTDYDFDEAIRWLSQAARGGNHSAILKLQRFGYGSLVADENQELEDFDTEGLDNDYDYSEKKYLEALESNTFNENNLLLLGEATVISFKNHAQFQMGKHSTPTECATTFWTSLLGGISDDWKKCIAIESKNEIVLNGPLFDEQIKVIENAFSLARSVGNFANLEIHIFFESIERDADIAKVPVALYQDGNLEAITSIKFFWQSNERLWFILF